MSSDSGWTGEKLGKLHDGLKRIRSQKHPPPLGRCMYWAEPCSEKPIGSHALSKCWLEKILWDGHVLKFVGDLKIVGNHTYKILRPDGVGWGEASVFQAFCNSHDTSLFRNLDRLDIAPTQDDCLKLAYRSVCREFAAKHQVVGVYFKQGMAGDERGAKMMTPDLLFGLRLFQYKTELEEDMVGGNFGDYEHLILDMRWNPYLLGAATFTPLTTVRGKIIGPNPSLMTVTVLPTERKGMAVFTWKRVNNPWGAKYAQALRRTPPEQLGMALTRIMLETTDSNCLSANYWLSFDEKDRQLIVDTNMRSMKARFGNPPEIVPPATVIVPNSHTDRDIALPVKGLRTL